MFLSWQRLKTYEAITKHTTMEKETISILGCGWYGLALAEDLLADGYVVKGSTTNQEKLNELKAVGIRPYLINLASATDLDQDFFACDVLIVSIPPRKKEDVLFSYEDQIKRISAVTSSEIIFISSTGIYQDGNFVVDEETLPEPSSEVGKSLLAAEMALRHTASVTPTIIRFGGLIGPNRNLARHFAGKTKIANGLAPINLIHLYDCIGLTKAIMRQKAFGRLYHGVAPSHPSRSDFYTKACLESGMERPDFILELQSWKQIDSALVPSVLNYEWKILFSA